MDDESTGIEYVPLCRVGVTPGGGIRHGARQ